MAPLSSGQVAVAPVALPGWADQWVCTGTIPAIAELFQWSLFFGGSEDGSSCAVASMSSTFRAICVDVPREAPADAKSLNSPFAARVPALGR